MSAVIFGDYNSIDDFGLFCTGYEVSAPEVQRYTVDIPGRDGALELTGAMFAEPHYNNRTITIGFDAITADKGTAWPEIQSTVNDAIHGRQLEIIFNDDADYYWVGTVSVSGNAEEGDLEITVDAEPYKYAVSETVYEITESQTVTLTNGRMTAIPTVTVTDETTITVDDSTVSLSEGTYEMTDFPLYEGDTTWEIETDGTVTITYRQGRL